MDLREIKEVIRLMKTHDITDFELEKEGFKIVLKKEGQNNVHLAPQPIVQQPLYCPSPAMPEMPHVPQAVVPAKAPEAPAEDEKNIAYVLSPMVGTFYAAPSPESAPYVSKGQDIKADDVVCIVEAMKVFNEIKAEVVGTIVEIMAENGAPVEYGQRLFKIKTH